MAQRVDSQITSALLRHAGELATSMTQLRRVLSRVTRRDWPFAPFSSNHVELQRLASELPGISVAEAAAELRLAPNTVSTLVNDLRRAGLLAPVSDQHVCALHACH